MNSKEFIDIQSISNGGESSGSEQILEEVYEENCLDEEEMPVHSTKMQTFYVKPSSSSTSTPKVNPKILYYNLKQAKPDTPFVRKIPTILQTQTLDQSRISTNTKNIARLTTFVHTNNDLLKDILNEIKALRQDCKQVFSTSMSNNHTSATTTLTDLQLDLPRQTYEAFNELEDQLTYKRYEQAMIHFFKEIHELSLHKYVRTCLRMIISNEAACRFSWFGRNNNTAVKSYKVINIIKDAALEKFPSFRDSDITSIIKMWFQYSKDRQKKAVKKSFA